MLSQSHITLVCVTLTYVYEWTPSFQRSQNKNKQLRSFVIRRLIRWKAIISHEQNVWNALHPSSFVWSGVYLLQCVDDNALDRRPINVGVVGQRSWRHFDLECANQRRPACWTHPINAFQRAAARPIACLHDGTLWRLIYWERSFHSASLQYRKEKKTASWEAVEKRLRHRLGPRN